MMLRYFIIIAFSLFACQSPKNDVTKTTVSLRNSKGSALSREVIKMSVTNEVQLDIRRKYQYQVKGKKYHVFKSKANFRQVGIASWYGPGFHGKKTASGEIYNMHAMTAAHKTLPLGTRVEVTNLATGKKIRVRINDRGPFHKGRVIDLSKRAAKKLGMLKSGYAKVYIRTIK